MAKLANYPNGSLALSKGKEATLNIFADSLLLKFNNMIATGRNVSNKLKYIRIN